MQMSLLHYNLLSSGVVSPRVSTVVDKIRTHTLTSVCEHSGMQKVFITEI